MDSRRLNISKKNIRKSFRMTHPQLTAKIAHEKWVRKGKRRIINVVAWAWLEWHFPDMIMKFDYEN